MFVQEEIEKLKREWTDKYVVVAGDRPELRRFDGYTGQVKTVNMNGRALVQFDAWNNIGWFDIDLGYLTEVPKPDPALAGKKAEPKREAAPKAEAPKAAPAKPAGKMSVAEMIAAARANKPAATAAPAAKPAAAPAAKPAPAKPAGGKLSTAEILAAARAKKPAEDSGTTATIEATPTATAAEAKPAAAKPAGSIELPKGQRPTVAQMLAYCREHDTKA